MTEQASELIDRAEINAGTVLVEYSRTEAALAALREKYSGAQFDLTTTAGDKAARAARLDLKTLRTSLEAKRKELKAPAVEFGRKIDDEAKRITSEIAALEDPIDAQIKADEKRREDERLERERIAAERAAGFRAKIDAIRACVAKSQGLPSERISNGIAQVESIVTDEATWAEFAEEAAQAKSMTLAAMLNLRDSAKAREEEAARVEAQRLENERIAAEQRAAAEAIAAQQRALAEQAAALAAQQKAIDDAKAEAERKEREAQEAAARAEQMARLEQEHRKGSDGMWRTEIFSAEHGGVAAVCNWAPMPTVECVTGSYRAGNARRLVACWNACDGISTENLEQNTPVKVLADRYNAALGLLERIRFALGDPEGKLTESQLVRRAHELRQKAAKWDDWSDAQNSIETDMPEGYAFVLQCSPGDWDLSLTDQDGERVEFDRDNDTTAQMLLSAIEAAKAHHAATQAAAATGAEAA